MEIGNNIRTVMGYICITIVLVSVVIGYNLFFISLSLPERYTFDINITADDNLLNMTKTAERMQERQYDQHFGKDETVYFYQTFNNNETIYVLRCYQRRIITERYFNAEENNTFLYDSIYEEDIEEVNCNEIRLQEIK